MEREAERTDNGRGKAVRKASRGARHYSANMEDYLEAICTLGARNSPVTVTHLSDALEVSKPSVTAAVARLCGEGLVEHAKYGAIALTARGKTVADDVCRRHAALKTFLTEILGVSGDTAEEDACKLEHHLSYDSSVRLTRFIAYVLQDARGRPDWLDEFVESLNGLQPGKRRLAQTEPAPPSSRGEHDARMA